MAIDVFPPMNLAGNQVTWGREVQSRITRLDREGSEVRSSVENSSRAVGGNLSVVSAKLDKLDYDTKDLASRRTVRVDVPDISASVTLAANANGQDVTNATTVTLAPPHPRGGPTLITFSGSFDVTNSATSASPALMRLDYLGDMVAPIPVAAGAGPSRPAYADGGNWSTSIDVPPGGADLVFTVRVTSFVNRWNGTAGSAGVTASNLSITMTFG